MTGHWVWALLPGQCVGCGVCADVCTSAAITMDRSQAEPEPVAQRCVGCMDCVRECPTDAITVNSIKSLANSDSGR